MREILNDIKAASEAFVKMRQMRKEGAEIKVRYSREIPCVSLEPAFYNTVEGCVLSYCSADIRKSAQGAFLALPYEKASQLENPPKDGEFIERAHFWRSILEPVMTPEQCRKSMIAIIHWYIHIKQMRKAKDQRKEGPCK